MTPGGGGMGPATERDAAALQRDIDDERVSPAKVKELYKAG